MHKYLSGWIVHNRFVDTALCWFFAAIWNVLNVIYWESNNRWCHWCYCYVRLLPFLSRPTNRQYSIENEKKNHEQNEKRRKKNLIRSNNVIVATSISSSHFSLWSWLQGKNMFGFQMKSGHAISVKLLTCVRESLYMFVEMKVISVLIWMWNEKCLN